ncbi:MAG TPA: hypothetical protein VH278_12275 [Burkholderiaceae bacterium]|nr:hypothetical protein [Burkholderiaceae bacterium]
MHRLSIVAIALAACALQPAQAAGSDAPAVVTILEGSATVIRGTSKLGAAEGVRLQPNDLIETEKDTYAQLEYADGTRLDLGPTTRLQLNYPSEVSGDRPALYLLSGWIKLSLPQAKGSRAAAFSSVVFDGIDLGGVVLVHIDARGGALFVEQGKARLANRHGKPFAVPPLNSDDFVSVTKDGHTTRDARPSKEFVDQMPRAFRDSIPSRLARYREHEVAPRALGEFSYAEVEPWINAEVAVRRQFVHAWRTRADDPAFRLELTGKLSLHPEWGPVLFPELYAPKPAAEMMGPPWPLPQPGPAPR